MSDGTNFPLADANRDGTIPHNNLTHLKGASAAPAETCSSSRGDHPANSRRAANPPAKDRRRRRRALISAPVRVRGIHITENGPDEISTTIDVSRGGILFATRSSSFYRGMDLAVTFPFCDASDAIHAEQPGRVVRVHDLPDGRRAVAIALGVGVGEDLVDSSGRKLDKNPVRVGNTEASRPLVLAVDADALVRETLKNYLSNEGYEVMTVGNGPDARKILDVLTPALLIAEVEGEDLPGFDLCAFIKATPHLKKIPVLLTTRSGNPTDYANAHSLGAVVCMAKPYKQDRLGHVVRLLAPHPKFLHTGVAPPRTPDSSRRACTAKTPKPMEARNGSWRFRFPSIR